MKSIAIKVLMLTAVCFNAFAQPSAVRVASPNQSVEFLLLSNATSSIIYTVQFKNKTIIERSRLGLLIDSAVIGNNNFLGEITRYAANETYPHRGVHAIAVNHYQGARITILDKDKLPSWILDVRVFNDGVAFRYIVDKKGTSRVETELTQFIIPAGSTVWSQSNIKYYESSYAKSKIEDIKEGSVAGPPVTIQLPSQSAFAAITEAGLTDFAGMHLLTDGKNGYQAGLSGITRKNDRIETPWRVIEVAPDLNGLVNCDIISNVSPPHDPKLFPKGFQTEWIKPGRSVWSWLAVNRSVTLENMKVFSNLAAQLGFEYNLVDEGWSAWQEGEKDAWQLLKELVEYSTAQGVKIWLWKAYPYRKGIPGIKDSTQRNNFFQKCKEAGIAGVKIDFFDSENQEIIQFYQAALRDAARYQLMVNFHGANKPTGESRTFPNEMSREAIRGMEGRPPWAPGNTTLPFTRYLAGHADFTPIHFGNRMGEVSWAHHIASMVIFTSPFLCVGADPQDILNHPAKEIIKHIPPVWDETIVLGPSVIGELAVFARRKGDVWYIAALNNNSSNTIKFDCSFLPKGKYKMTLVKDEAGKQTTVKIEHHQNITRKSVLTIPVNVAGGFVAMLEKD